MRIIAALILVLSQSAIAGETLQFKAGIGFSRCAITLNSNMECSKGLPDMKVMSVEITPSLISPNWSKGAVKLNESVESVSIDAILQVSRVEYLPSPTNPTRYGHYIRGQLVNKASVPVHEFLRPDIFVLASAGKRKPKGDYWSDMDHVQLTGDAIKISETEFIIPTLYINPEELPANAMRTYRR